ncbi:Alpha/Beta hydrolase protein [Lactifluus subvellereus]|nr:Alpha/Beta hydrolase protein [Lactifluus subvellereus]
MSLSIVIPLPPDFPRARARSHGNLTGVTQKLSGDIRSASAAPSEDEGSQSGQSFSSLFRIPLTNLQPILSLTQLHHPQGTHAQRRRHCPSNTTERKADILPLLIPGTERRIHYPRASPARSRLCQRSGLHQNGGITKPEQITRFTESALVRKTLCPLEDSYFEGAEGEQVNGYVVKPYGWREGDVKKWPGLLFIHGGTSARMSLRQTGRAEEIYSWNPNVFAHQGYFIVAINPTGSTTFDQDFTYAITKDWGGKPFVDLQRTWKYALDKYPEIDLDRAVAAGASWGGYAMMASLMQLTTATPLRSFSFLTMIGAAIPGMKKQRRCWGKINPINYVDNKNYRLPKTDWIGAFHALQQCAYLRVAPQLVIFPDETTGF